MTIDTTSYTNKDFRTIFPELLDLVTQLTSKWDPNASNEADPGVVLMKLQAFIADKLNYNLDKNILENFPSSVTQRGNAQKLYDLLGYNMQWYKSATVNLLFKYVKGKNTEHITTDYIIPRFTQIQDDSGEKIYTLIEDAVVLVEGDNYADVLPTAMEGTIHDYTLNGSTTITVDRLDADYRLYFNEQNIAQNGIFVYNIDTPYSLWETVNNLEATQLGRNVFKFGVLPVTNTCYIEFPQDSAELFGNGINIKYILSSGSNGNIPAFTLTGLNTQCMSNSGDVTHYTDNVEEVSTTPIDLALYTKVRNAYSADNGQDPETVGEAYKNFQRTVDTFNTLVTVTDYENAIYNEGAVSNVVVSDRTNDLQHSYVVKSKSLSGDEELVVTDTKVVEGETVLSMSPFNISVYALQKSPSVYDDITYNKTFLTSIDVQDDAQDSISDYKSVQHDWLTTQGYLPFLYKNLYRLDGKLLTYSKVTEKEATDIEKNVQVALYKNFHSAKLEFGVEIDYEDLVDVIKNSDTRIKTVMLDEPTLICNVMDQANNLYNINDVKYLEDSTNLSGKNQQVYDSIIDLYAKSILAGVTPFIRFNENMNLNYYMQNTSGYVYNEKDKKFESRTTLTDKESFIDSVAYLTTETSISLTKGSVYNIKENETVHLYAPNYISEKELSSYLYVAIKFAEGNVEHHWFGTGSKILAKDSLYQLRPGEKLLVTENLNDMTEHWKGNPTEKNSYTIEYPSIIKPNFDFEYRAVGETDDNGKAIKVHNLETNDTITVMKPNSVQINAAKKTILACWIANNPENKLFEETDFEQDGDVFTASKILRNDEIFIYTDKNKSDLILLQSGTRLRVTVPLATHKKWSGWLGAEISLSEIQTSGAAAEYDWTEIPVSFEFFTDEMQVISLGEGTAIGFDDLPTGVGADFTLTLTNDPQDVTDCNFWYRSDGVTKVHLPQINLCESTSENSWYAFSNLSGVISPVQPFTLKENQSIISYTIREEDDGDGNIVVSRVPNGKFTNGQTLTSNVIALLYGGIEQNVQAMDSDGKLKTVLSLTTYGSKSDDEELWTISDTTNWTNVTVVNSDWTQTTLECKNIENINTNSNITLTLQLGSVFKNAVIPIAFSADTENYDIICKTGTPFKDGFDTTDSLVNNVVYYLQPVYNDVNSTISFEFKPCVEVDSKTYKVTRFTITMWQPKSLGNNATVNEEIPENYRDAVSNRVIELAKCGGNYNLFDYTYSPNSDVIIENPKSPESFFLPQHIRNKYTIAQLDTSNINVTVMKQSRK